MRRVETAQLKNKEGRSWICRFAARAAYGNLGIVVTSNTGGTKRANAIEVQNSGPRDSRGRTLQHSYHSLQSESQNVSIIFYRYGWFVGFPNSSPCTRCPSASLHRRVGMESR